MIADKRDYGLYLTNAKMIYDIHIYQVCKNFHNKIQNVKEIGISTCNDRRIYDVNYYMKIFHTINEYYQLEKYFLFNSIKCENMKKKDIAQTAISYNQCLKPSHLRSNITIVFLIALLAKS